MRLDALLHSRDAALAAQDAHIRHLEELVAYRDRIVAERDGQLAEAQGVAELAQLAEILARIAFRGRNAHQSFASERRQRTHLLEQRGDVLRQDAGLLCLAPDVHFQQHALDEARGFRPLRQLLREREAVAGMDQRGATHDQLRLVGLKRADEVPLDSGPERFRFPLHLLRVVLAEDGLPGRDCLAQHLYRLRLAHRDQPHRGRIAARPGTGSRDAPAHARETRRYVHGSSMPASASICSVSASGRPTTLVKLPSMRSTNAPASPWTA